MPTVTIIDPQGYEHTLDASVGESLMTVAVNENIDGILAECGGGCACATCHCIIDEKWIEKVGEPEDIESELLDFAAAGRQPGSRLSCQIFITDELDGLIASLPDSQ